MRLIDLDKAVTICDEDDNAVIYTNIKNAEVKAIPIEWLLKERDKNKEIAETLSKADLNIDFIAKYGYTRSSHKVFMIEELLLDWSNYSRKLEKENGYIQDK